MRTHEHGQGAASSPLHSIPAELSSCHQSCSAGIFFPPFPPVSGREHKEQFFASGGDVAWAGLGWEVVPGGIEVP